MTFIAAAILLARSRASALPWPSACDSAVIVHVFAALAMAGYLWEIPGMALAFGVATAIMLIAVALCAGPEYMFERHTAPPHNYWVRVVAIAMPFGINLLVDYLFGIVEDEEDE